MRKFVKLLSLDYRRELRRLKRQIRAGDPTQEDLTWEEIIADAREIVDYSSLTPEDAVSKIKNFNVADSLRKETIVASPASSTSGNDEVHLN